MKSVIPCLAICCVLFLSFSTSAIQPEQYTFQWEFELDEGYISTSPLIVEESIFVRASGFWSGENRPSVISLSIEGDKKWEYVNNDSIRHDLSPLLYVDRGQGDCGSWSEQLLVGWANGEISAHHPHNGTLIWNHYTIQDSWGITGKMAIVEDTLYIPTRNGLALLCLSNGEVLEEYTLGYGWRNGVTVADDGVWQGDEQGVLWHIANTTVTPHYIGEGAIRHAPLITDAGVLVHLQQSSGSSIFVFNKTNGSLTLLNQSSFSPGIPIQKGNLSITTDSDYIRVYRCESTCTYVDQFPSHSNGEIALDTDGRVWVNQNVIGGGWLILGVNATGNIVSNSSINSTHDGYSTSSPTFFQSRGSIVAFGNDFGILEVYANFPLETPSEVPYSWMSLVYGGTFLCFIMFSGFKIIQGHEQWAIRMYSMSLLICVLMLTPEFTVVVERSTPDFLIEESNEEVWDPTWPTDWNGTQVIIIEFPSGSFIDGGYLGHQSVEALTVAVAQQNNITIVKEEMYFGTYIMSIDGIEENGWEFYIDGQLGQTSVDVAKMPESGILRWTLAS